MANYGPNQVAICVHERIYWNEEVYDERRGNIEYSDGLISAGTHNLLVSGHKSYRRNAMIVSGHCLCVFPFILGIPYFDEQVSGA